MQPPTDIYIYIYIYITGGRSVGIVRSRTKGHGVFLYITERNIEMENLKE
jgi:hypothetical protein